MNHIGDVIKMVVIKECPINLPYCPCEDFSKEGFCDWPYRVGMTLEEIQEITNPETAR